MFFRKSWYLGIEETKEKREKGKRKRKAKETSLSVYLELLLLRHTTILLNKVNNIVPI